MVLNVISESSESSSSESTEDDLWTEEDLEPFVLWGWGCSLIIPCTNSCHPHQVGIIHQMWSVTDVTDIQG